MLRLVPSGGDKELLGSGSRNLGSKTFNITRTEVSTNLKVDVISYVSLEFHYTDVLFFSFLFIISFFVLSVCVCACLCVCEWKSCPGF